MVAKFILKANAPLLLCLLAVSCVAEPANDDGGNQAQVEMISPASTFDLKPVVLEQRKREALSGNGQSALAVALYYDSLNADGAPEKSQRTLEWFRIAAENGNVTGAVNYAIDRSSQNDRNACADAIEWLDRAERMPRATEADRSTIARARADILIRPRCVG